MRLRALLVASLLANAALAAGLFHKTADTRAYYWQRWTAGTPSVAPEPPTTRLGGAPTQPPAFAQGLLDTAEPAHAYRGETGTAFGAWRQRGRAAFARCLGYAPRPFGGEVRVVALTEFPTFTREKLYLKTQDGLWLPAYVLVPKGAKGPLPTVLALPGHDGPTAITGQGAASIAGGDTAVNYMRAFGMRLAEAGYMVVAIDVAGIGELADMDYLKLVNAGLLAGKPLKRLMLEEVHEAMDFVLSRPEVDPERVGTAGMSLGGELALFAGVLDPRVKFVAASGFFSSYRDYAHTSAASLFIPGVLAVADIPDLAAMVAPRPLHLQSAALDSMIAYDKLDQYHAKVQQAYRAAGAPDAVSRSTVQDNHVMGPTELVDWLKRTVPTSI
ncbi:MAG: dienelactone hydrolase family protein [Candidatus Sericytochromatia bacterium]